MEDGVRSMIRTNIIKALKRKRMIRILGCVRDGRSPALLRQSGCAKAKWTSERDSAVGVYEIA